MMPAWFARFMLRLLGVRVIDHNKGNWPRKYVMPVVTHTSNRDFWYGVYSRAILGEYIRFVGKASLFKGPLGVFLKWMGGVPVVREKRSNFVDSVADIFKERDEFRLSLAVEGTRAKVDHFKTGFYFIAKKAGVPLVMCKFDFGNEGVIEFSEPYHLTDDIRADFDFIYRYFEGAIGLVPENSFVYDPKVLDLLPKE
ncbi:1-acyl-sn-glycerol-3-phosphate acyltransferase [Neolewinella persica]|uniref:1-acyl-sn-glycerol-3-phosphate acyltransferase n=1 Tax=Neolewinella persica TaxID=70998 RepID=UPI00035DFF27|nr:1-acyl-sn-glycerol-3-phosphate acyltransferase [Neolewinella persica]